MFEKRLSEIPEPKQSNRRLSVVSNSDTAKPENNSSFHTYVVSPVQTFFHSHVVRPSKEYPLMIHALLLHWLIILINVLPSSSEITGKSSNQKRLDIPTPSIPTPSIPDVPSSVEPAVSAVSGAVTGAANTAVNTAADIAAKAPGLLSQLLSAFDKFKPRTSSLLNTIACFFDLLLFVWVFDLISIIPGIGSQNTGPGIYLATMSASFITVAAILLCISSCGSAIKSTSKCLKKLRRTKVNDAEKGEQYSYF
ncbi:10815_t:CDS:2 [Dentiscutata heterogama]|uniref:10815_t:CDS:1 n=1 Tax=Dentiscutata heterogama TaxID=1316150 RepID=A0ACA9MP43_9GLOM|nr:10815_t:CDS:2 [Dentiscutata heterogama]